MSVIPIAILSTDKHLDLDSKSIVESITKQEIKLAKDLGVDTIIDLGDYFNSRKAQPLQVLRSFDKNNELYVEAGIKRILIPGNHDKVDYESKNSYLDEFRYHPNITLFTECGASFDFPFIDKTIIHFLPYFDEATIYGFYLDKIVQIVESNKNYKHILITHVGINGVLNNDEEKIINSVKKDMFGIFDKVLIGHYHNKQHIEPNIDYIGSCYPRNFGEDNNKGFTILNSDGSITFSKAQFREYKTINIELNDEDNLAINDLYETHKFSEDHIRFKIYGTIEQMKTVNINKIKSGGIKVTPVIKSIQQGVEIASAENYSAFDKKAILSEFELFSKEMELSTKVKTYFKEQITKKLNYGKV